MTLQTYTKKDEDDKWDCEDCDRCDRMMNNCPNCHIRGMDRRTLAQERNWDGKVREG